MGYKYGRHGENWDYSTLWHVWGELGHDGPFLPVSVPLFHICEQLLYIFDINCVNVFVHFLYPLKGLAQAKIIKKSVILFRVLNMTI